MKKSNVTTILIAVVVIVVIAGVAVFKFGKGSGGDVATGKSWPGEPVTVICPWAVGGVADVVNRKMATFGQEYLGQPVLATNELGAGGNVALTNYLKNAPNSTTLILGGEGAFGVSPNVPGAEVLQFTFDDYIPVINLYSAIFIMTGEAKLNINNLDDLKKYATGKKIKVDVNGTTSSEAFLAKALFKELGIDYELVAYNGANLALDAAAKGETQFAISHQSQAKASVEGGTLKPIVAFDEKGLTDGLFAGVKGVGEYGYNAYFRNRAFLMVRAGTDPAICEQIYNAFSQILKEPEVVELFETLMIEVDPIDEQEMREHVDNVATIVKSNL